MNRIALLSLAVASGLVAQSNVVPGLDGRLSEINDLTYWGRRGAAHPNGQVGISMLNTMCNPGSVNIPWAAAMQSNHPYFGFQLVRLHNDRIEQINDWSFVKHAFTSTNFSGACGSCQNPGTGALMGVNCSDTYGAGNNGDRVWLGPPVEINAWLGTWNPVGSYFDIGDPAQAGYPAAADGVRSLSQSIFDDVRNRMTVNESDLLTAGASYFYGIQLIHRGEAVANRGDNLASRGTNPNYSGGTWSFPNNAAGMTLGTILTRWPGASIEVGQNGNDDGRFFVASKTTALGGGVHHYEYAVHNVDNHRGGATLRIPIDAGAVASNFTFGDIDTNATNDWTAARVGNEIVFTAPGNNPQNWNTIFNFGFDANFAPGNGAVQIDEARVGPGALFVTIGAKTPSGSTFATATNFGTGCGGTPGCSGSFYENGFDLANSGYTLAYNAGAYTLRSLTGTWIAPAGSTLTLGDDATVQQTLPFALPFPGGSATSLWVCSNGFVSSANNGSSYQPTAAALLTGQRTWAALWRDLDPSAGGTVRYDANAQRVVVTFNAVRNFGQTSTATFQWQFLANGTVHVIYQAVAAASPTLVGYSPGGGVTDPGAIDISAVLAATLPLCSPSTPPTPALALNASARPVVGTTTNLVTSNIPAGSLLGLSILSLNQLNIDLGFLQMPTCFLYAGLDSVTNFATPGASASVPWTLPNTPSLSGTLVVSQSATLTVGLNPFGFITSNGVQLVLGTL